MVVKVIEEGQKQFGMPWIRIGDAMRFCVAFMDPTRHSGCMSVPAACEFYRDVVSLHETWTAGMKITAREVVLFVLLFNGGKLLIEVHGQFIQIQEELQDNGWKEDHFGGFKAYLSARSLLRQHWKEFPSSRARQVLLVLFQSALAFWGCFLLLWLAS